MKSKKKKRLFIIAIAIIASVLVFVKVGAGQDNIIFDDSICKYETTIKDKPTDGSKPLDHNAYDNIAYLMGSLQGKNAFSATTTGISDASLAKIKIFGKRTVKDGKAIISSVSDGMVSNGKQKYFLDGKVLLRDAKKIDGFDTTWKEDGLECVSNKVYLNRYGWLPFQVTGYIICEETIVEDPVITKNADNTYSVTIKLNPGQDYAPFWYCREIVTNSNSSMMPVFYNIEITYTFTENWDILTSQVFEEYKVKAMGIEAVSKTNCLETYNYDNVEFDSNDYEFFKAHEDMDPIGNDEDTPDARPLADAVTMIVSSLQNDDKSDKNLSLELTIDKSNLNGIFSINLSDLNNIKVKALIDKLYIEYSDQIYLNYGSFSGKLSTTDLGKIMDQILNQIVDNEKETPINLDLQKILADINSAPVVLSDNGNIITIDPVINILGIDINMHFVLTHVDNIYRLIFAEANCDINDTSISAYLTETTETVMEMDKSNLVDLSNIDFILDDVINIAKNKKIKIFGNMSYQDLNIDANILIDLNKNIELALDLDISYQDITQNLKVKFVDRIIYIDYKNIKLKASFNEFKALILKYFDTKIPIDLNKFDIKNILNLIIGLDFESLINDLNIEKNNFEIALDLQTICEGLKELQVKIKQGENLELDLLYDNLKAKFDITSFDEDILVNDSEYHKLIFLNFIIDGVLGIVDSKKLLANVNLSYEDLLIEGIIKADFKAGLKLSFDTTITYQDILMKLLITYVNDYVYIDYQNLHLKISFDNLKLFLNKYLQIDLNLNQEIDYQKLIKGLLELDFDALIKDLKIEEHNFDIILDLKQFASDLQELKLSIEKGNNLSINAIYDKLNLSLKLDKLYDEITITNEQSYIDLAYLDFVLDNVMGLISDKKFSSNVNIVYQDLRVNGLVNASLNNEFKLYLDLNIGYKDINEHLIISYIDDVIYVDYENIKLKISYYDLDKILRKYFDVILPDIKNPNINIDVKEIVKTILTLDFESLIKKLEVTENKIDVILNLKVILENLQDLSLEIRNDTNLKFDIIYDKLTASLDISKFTGEITVNKDSYQDLNNISFIIDKLVSLMNDKKTELEFNLNLNEINLSGKGYFDFVNSVKFSLMLDVKSNTYGLNETLAINYLNDFIYVDYNLHHIKISVNDLNKILNHFNINISQDLENFDLNKLLNDLLNADLNTIIKELELLENELNVNLDLSSFVKELNDLRLVIKNSFDGFEIKVNIWDLYLKLIDNTTFNIEVNDKAYVSVTNFIDPVLDLIDLVNKKSINLNMNDGTVKLMVNGKEINLMVDMNLDLILVNNIYELEGNFNVRMDNVYVLIDFYLDSNNQLYLNVLNQTLVIDLNTENLKEFSDSLMNKINELDLGNKVSPVSSTDLATNPNNKTILDLINHMVIKENSLDINLDYLFNEIFNISLSLIKLEGNMDNIFGVKVEYGSLVNVDANIKVTESNVLAATFLDKHHVNITTLDILDLVSSVVDTINMNEFYVSLETGVNVNGQDIANITGNIMLRINSRNKDTFSYDLDLELFIQEYNVDGTPYQYHHLKITVLSKETLNNSDGMVYGMYGNGDKTNKPKDYIRVRSNLAGMEKLVNSVFSLVSNFNIEEVLNGLMATIKNMVNPDHLEFDLNSILNPIEFSNDLVKLSIPASLFNKKLVNKNIEIGLSKYNGKLENIILDGIYFNYKDSLVYEKLNHTTINIYHPKTNDDLSYSDKVLIKEPSNVNDYKFDLSNLHYLIESLKNTALQKEFNIKGNIELSVLSLIKINLGIDVKVMIDGNNETTAHIHLDVPYIFAMLSQKTVDIYYEKEMVYINRIDDNGDQYKIKMHYTTFLDDIVYWLLKYAIAVPDSIYNKITESTTENSPFIDASNCVTKVEITNNSYTFGFDLRVLTGNSNLGILELTLNSYEVPTVNGNNEEVRLNMLKSITNVSLGLVSDVVKIKASSLNLVNFTDNGVNKIDMSKFDDYMNSTLNDQNDMYYEYKNNSWKATHKIDHSIIFDLMYLDNLEARYTEGDKINLPSIKDIISYTDNDGLHYYKFSGWYMDEYYQTPFNLDLMPSHKVWVYAKWVEVTRTIVIESSLYNDRIEYITYDGASVEDLYNLLPPVTAGTEVYGLTGFMNGNDVYDDLLINNDLVLTPVWEKVIYKVNIDNKIIDLDFTSEKPIVESGKYMIYIDGIYYLVDSSMLSANNIYTYFKSGFNSEFVLDILNYERVLNYNEVIFNVDKEFNDKVYYGIMVENNSLLNSSLIPNKTTLDYEINAWEIDNVYYDAQNINLVVDKDYTLNAYISVKKEYFKYKQNNIIGFNNNYQINNIKDLVLPIFNLEGEQIIGLLSVKDTNNYYHGAFEGCNSFNKVVIPEGYKKIDTNSFKNCKNLREVYLPSTLEVVDRYAFYYDFGKFNDIKPVIENMRFYSNNDNVIRRSNLIAVLDWKNSEFTYGNKYSGFNPVDLRNAFQTK